jgi:chemosensory pili system protein ChpA (sensor histidine kinase/response regulator)
MVRQIGEELKKPVQLSIQAEGEMDRTILERLIAPIEHMLRNAIDHGIESPAERKKLKKPEQGRVGIRLYREGAEVVVEIADDGRGIDLDKVRAKAIERGLIAPDASLTDHELQLMILEAGFSTADKVTQISGRGVGMDVVNSEIKQMGGLIDIQSQRGQGTTIIARLPFTVSVNQALMVKSGDEVYAIPLTNIEGIVRVSPYELMEYYNADDPVYMYAGEPYALRYLGKLLDPAAKPNLEGLTRPLPLLLLHGVEHPVALQVDELQGSREIVVKSVGTQLSSITGLSGATILGDGRVVLILDLPALWRRADAPVVEAEAKAKQLAEQEVEKAPTVMVVDDSITVRKVTSRLLQRHGFDVITAKDGVDAVNVLHDRIPDVMLLDIEMPRMDGFELATMIRHDDRLRHLPIVMITSRTGDKHRSRAEAIGVDRYMGKPYNEVDLLRTIEDLLGR